MNAKNKLNVKRHHPISLFMMKGKIGDVFYSIKDAKSIQASASIYDRKVATEKMYVISVNKKKPSIDFISKVTILF
jgi:hypothetical protein